jgi:hypothetical protein
MKSCIRIHCSVKDDNVEISYRFHVLKKKTVVLNRADVTAIISESFRKKRLSKLSIIFAFLFYYKEQLKFVFRLEKGGNQMKRCSTAYKDYNILQFQFQMFKVYKEEINLSWG